MLKHINTITLKISLPIIVYLQTISFGLSQDNFGDVVINLDDSVNTSVPTILATASFIMGAFLGLSGFLLANKAKGGHHQQGDMGTAITRIFIGGALIVLPIIIGAIGGSFGDGGAPKKIEWN